MKCQALWCLVLVLVLTGCSKSAPKPSPRAVTYGPFTLSKGHSELVRCDIPDGEHLKNCKLLSGHTLDEVMQEMLELGKKP